jgi:hypothetical protein
MTWVLPILTLADPSAFEMILGSISISLNSLNLRPSILLPFFAINGCKKVSEIQKKALTEKYQTDKGGK